MRKTTLLACLLWATTVAFAQTDRGTITGTVTDPAGAVIATAPVEARNVETGAVYQAASSATGNYTLAQLPAGTYEMTVKVPGFKVFIRQNLALPVAQTLRIDVALEVGSAAESITVSDEAPLLKTESGELSHNVATDTLNRLPVLGVGSGNAGIRNPYAVLQVLPGSDWRPDSSIRLNGLPSNSMALRIEGQDATNGLSSATQSQTQPSVDAIQEFAIQTSNYSAEFGQAGGGLFNLTMKSGTNQFHGSAYDYFVNEALNAGQPFTNDGSGHLLRPRQRRNDYGFTVGGPIFLPKLYDGHNKSFFFFNFEQFRENLIVNNKSLTVPIDAYRTGDFGAALTGRSVGQDQLGRPLAENMIFDPNSDFVENSLRFRNPFPNNVIPTAQLDPVAVAIQKLIPAATRGGLVNNYLPVYSNPRTTDIPSVKLDHNLSNTMKLSGYWSRTATSTLARDGFPDPITTATSPKVTAYTYRVNFDYTMRPTMLLHLGAGLQDNTDDRGASFDPSAIGLKGATADLFPSLQALSEPQGGVNNMGPGSVVSQRNLKPTGNVSLTWVRDNHTFKFGGEFIIQSYLASLRTYTSAWMLFDPQQSGLPALNGVALPTEVGFRYASFLLGRPNSGWFAVPSRIRLGNHSYSGFVQDSWKVTRALTLDYGLRYDFGSYLRANHGYMFNLSLETPNPAMGGRPGGIIYEGNEPGRCQCNFAQNYPWAFGPRLGLAYQITPKTVLRAGVGVSYGRQNALNGKTNNAGSSNSYGTPAYGDGAFIMGQGIPFQVSWPNFDPGSQPLPGTIGTMTNFIDRNAGRPSRIVQWSIGLQREVFTNLMVEAEYIGNRGVWFQANTATNVNALRPAAIEANGLSLDNPADLQLLRSPLSSALAKSRGFSGLPYAGFPSGATVMQALRPMPGYSAVVNTWPPLGDSWYDALQVKATKRFSRGLDFTYSFTWSKQFDLGAEHDYAYFTPVSAAINDVDNRRVNKYLSGYNQPFLSVLALNYTTPALQGNRVLSWAARDWAFGTVLRYGSGLPIKVPTATSGLNAILGQNTFVTRVPDQPVLLADLNCHCFDPNTTFVLNPKAWVNPPAGKFGTAAAYYDDYRYQRRPSESMSLARNFRLGEGRMNFMVRAEFTNIFNRTQMGDPSVTNAFATQTRKAGQATAGFGWINTTSVAAPPRQGTLVARFTF